MANTYIKYDEILLRLVMQRDSRAFVQSVQITRKRRDSNNRSKMFLNFLEKDFCGRRKNLILFPDDVQA